MSGIDRLYSDVIKRHNSAPFHFGKKAGSGPSIKAYNPVCGDRFEIFVDRDGSHLSDLHFEGFGCAISKASTSVMIESLIGKSPKDALVICKQFLANVEDQSIETGVTLPEEFQAFKAVQEYPGRIDCATLAWKEMKKYLEMLP